MISPKQQEQEITQPSLPKKKKGFDEESITFEAYRAGYEDALERNRRQPFSESLKIKGIGCGRIISIIMLLIVGSFVVLVYTIVAKPPMLWSTLVSFLNNGLAFTQEPSGSNFSDVQTIINNQITSVGDQEIRISEDEVEILVQESVGNAKTFVDISPDAMRFYWVIDSTIPENPLYGVAEIKARDIDTLYIEKLGTNRVYFPSFLNDQLANLARSAFKFGTDGSSRNIVYDLLRFDKNYAIKDIRFEEGVMIVTLEVSVQLIS